MGRSMAKLYFRYGAMNSGKSTALLQVAHNYEERGQQILLLKPSVDSKGGATLVSRLGVRRDVDVLVGPEDDVRALIHAARLRIWEDTGKPIDCILVDEAQFLSADQVDGLLITTVLDRTPVLAYGLRTDFQTVGFPGAVRLLEVAHSLEELKTICRCGRKATLNMRLVGNRAVFDGDQVAIDEQGDISYESVCATCYLNTTGGELRPR
jgi:thymidine kinase